jgi:hypothetical protein
VPRFKMMAQCVATETDMYTIKTDDHIDRIIDDEYARGVMATHVVDIVGNDVSKRLPPREWLEGSIYWMPPPALKKKWCKEARAASKARRGK